MITNKPNGDIEIAKTHATLLSRIISETPVKGQLTKSLQFAERCLKNKSTQDADFIQRITNLLLTLPLIVNAMYGDDDDIDGPDFSEPIQFARDLVKWGVITELEFHKIRVLLLEQSPPDDDEDEEDDDEEDFEEGEEEQVKKDLFDFLVSKQILSPQDESDGISIRKLRKLFDMVNQSEPDVEVDADEERQELIEELLAADLISENDDPSAYSYRQLINLKQDLIEGADAREALRVERIATLIENDFLDEDRDTDEAPLTVAQVNRLWEKLEAQNNSVNEPADKETHGTLTLSIPRQKVKAPTKKVSIPVIKRTKETGATKTAKKSK